MLTGPQQGAYIKVWTALEEARNLVASCRSSTIFPSTGGLLDPDPPDNPNTCDKISRSIAELRDWVYTQMGQT